MPTTTILICYSRLNKAKTTTKTLINHLLPNLCLVTPWKDSKVTLQGTCLQAHFVTILHLGLTEEYVVLQGSILNPSLLGHIGHLALCAEWTNHTGSFYSTHHHW